MVPVLLMRRLMDLVLKGLGQAAPVELMVTLHEEVWMPIGILTWMLRQGTLLTDRKLGSDP